MGAKNETQNDRPRLGAYVDLVFRPFPEAVLTHLEVDQTVLEIDLCEHVLAQAPRHVDALKVLGNAYTAAKRYVDGLKIDKQLVEILPEDGTVHYNLACSYALLGLKDQAFEALKRALSLGYDDLEHLLQDEDLVGLRGDPRFKELLE